MRNLPGYLILLLATTTATAFQLSPTRTLRHHASSLTSDDKRAVGSPIRKVHPSSSTSLNGKLWKRLNIEEDDPEVDGT